MKILLIHNKYEHYGGEDVVVASQIELLRRNGHKVITYFKESEDIKKMNFGKFRAFISGIYNSHAIKEIKEIIKNEKPEIVHIHNLYPLISPAILPVIKKMGIPIVMTVHNYRLLCPNGLFFTKGKICESCTKKGKEINCIKNNCEGSLFKSTGYALRNFWARRKSYYNSTVDVFLCLTQFQKNKLVANGFQEKKCRILPNFNESNIEEIEYSIENRTYVAFAGRISPEKGIQLLLSAARNLPEIQFKLAGGIQSDFQNKLDIPDNVTLLGMLDSKDLASFFSKARFLVLSSIWYEGFPMVLPEAMTHKLPLIAPKMAGFAEIVVENKNGLLFESANAESLTNTIAALWKNHELTLNCSKNNFIKVKTQYTSKIYFAGLMSTYNYLLS